VSLFYEFIAPFNVAAFLYRIFDLKIGIDASNRKLQEMCTTMRLPINPFSKKEKVCAYTADGIKMLDQHRLMELYIHFAMRHWRD